ncbi:helix-turn-helix transcriptional regulator [Chryseobacterium sp. H1D6B]|uniref:helix-turn-helix domain-containing protein n=1 Tax=Chryseobacterium sp. H1D6B TaxID=2940588 RepID=UPI0015CCA771|nr:helix-turn-helix transcriptional regulator [Chryseobacterium sp. H1D6B]
MHKLSLITLFFLNLNLYFSQSIKNFHIPDSLKTKSFEKLENSYNKVFRIDNNKAELYANVILSKAKREKNNNLIYDGYYRIAHTRGLKAENGHPYADTLLNITRSVNNRDYPAKAYIIKGILLNYEFKYNKALDYYINAQKSAADKNPDQFYYIKKLVGILKTATGENEEALPLFLEYYNYEKQKIQTKDKDIKSYIGSIFSLSNSYSKNKNYQQSKLYNQIGLAECKKYNDYTHYTYFVMSDGIADYYLKNYNLSSLNLLKTETDLLRNKDYANLSIIYYYLGKIAAAAKNDKDELGYFIKSDSLSFVSSEFLPVTRDQYEVLIDYYKKKGDKEKQLKYIDRLFYADSIMNSSRQYLSKEIYKKYDTPILFKEKEKLIDNLNHTNFLLYWMLSIGFIALVILIYVYVKNRKKIKEYQKQAEILLLKSKQSVFAAPDSINNFEEKEVPRDEKAKSILSDEKLQNIKLKLEDFENNKMFLNKNITVDSLARDLSTNRDYLSKSVNELKEMNFSKYLNELRINYIVEELNKNEKLWKHTISAIADDIGYNNSESFSNAFRKITGTLPSYYIKVLQENKKNSAQ